MRRRSNPGDSLEMFLDTICNTFGGILFILLFVVLQLRNVHDSVVTSRQEVSAAEVAALQNEKDQLFTELESLQSFVSTIDDVSDAMKATPEAQERFKEVKKTTSQLEQIKGEIQTIEARIEAILGQYVESEDLDKLQEEIRTLEESVKQEKSANRDLKEQKKRDVSLPQLHSSSKREVAIILRFGRLYFWHQYDSGGSRLGLNRDDFTIVEEDEYSQSTVPNPWCGIDLYAEDALAQLKQSFQKFDPEERKLIIIVFPDSFDCFGFVRDFLKKQKYDIAPWAFGEDTDIGDRGGSGNKAQ